MAGSMFTAWQIARLAPPARMILACQSAVNRWSSHLVYCGLSGRKTAQRSGGQERDHEFWTIVQHGRDRVALPSTERTQPGCAALNTVGQFVVADPLGAQTMAIFAGLARTASRSIAVSIGQSLSDTAYQTARDRVVGRNN
jgi:hypothetical protein